MAVSIGAAALAAGVGAASNIGQSIYSTERNIANSNYQVLLNQQFERQMASTQYQRAVQDMKAAGLNPGAIGAGGFGSNSVPSAAAATGNYGHVLGNDFTGVFSSAVAAAMAKDKHVTSEIVQQMKSETAEQVANIRNQGALELQDRKSSSALEVAREYGKQNLKVAKEKGKQSLEAAKERGKQFQYGEMYKKAQGHRSYLSPGELAKLYAKRK